MSIISNRMCTIRERVGGWFLILSMTILCFFVYSGNATVNKIDIPCIKLPFPPLYLVLLVSALIVIILVYETLLNPIVQVDFICVFLTIRILLHFVPLLYMQSIAEVPVNLFTSVLCLLAYIIGLKYTKDKQFAIKAVGYLFFVLCIQTVAEIMLGNVSFYADTYNFKNNLIIPYGGSNAITVGIIACYSFLMCCMNSKLKKLVVSIIAIAVIAATKSRSGLIVVVLMLCITLLWRSKPNINKILKLVFALLAVAIVGILFISLSPIGAYVFYGNTSTILGRMDLLEHGLRFFLQHPIFGNGFSEVVINNNPHNWIIHILMRSGLCGMFICIALLLCIVPKLIRHSDDSLVRGVSCLAIAMLIQGLAEIVLFSYTYDILLWFAIGMGMHQCMLYKEK